LNEIRNKCKEYRERIIEIVSDSHIGHLGGTLSLVEILTFIYWYCNKRTKGNVILSKGHAVLLQYIILKDLGIIDEDLSKYGFLESSLETHPLGGTQGIIVSSGSLGQGLSCGVGYALGLNYVGKKEYTYVILGDGELNEGQIWEALSSIIEYNLTNLITIIDINGYQLDSKTKEFYEINTLNRYFTNMGFYTEICDGHSLEELKDSYEKITSQSRTGIILAKTIKGKGISFMENNNNYHSGFTENYKEEIILAKKEVGCND